MLYIEVEQIEFERRKEKSKGQNDRMFVGYIVIANVRCKRD